MVCGLEGEVSSRRVGDGKTCVCVRGRRGRARLFVYFYKRHKRERGWFVGGQENVVPERPCLGAHLRESMRRRRRRGRRRGGGRQSGHGCRHRRGVFWMEVRVPGQNRERDRSQRGHSGGGGGDGSQWTRLGDGGGGGGGGRWSKRTASFGGGVVLSGSSNGVCV